MMDIARMIYDITWLESIRLLKRKIWQIYLVAKD